MVEQGHCPEGTPVEVQLRGGLLTIEVEQSNRRVWMTGPAVTVYEGMAEV